MNIIEYFIDDDKEDSGLNAISLVENPAIELDWVALNKIDNVQLKVVDEEKRLVLGAILVPNKPILRLSEDNEEYYIYFSKETLVKALQKYMRSGKQGETTLEHKTKLNGQEVYLTEVWIKEDLEKDKSAIYNDVAPIGSIMGSVKIENDELWEQVKSGSIKGFSIEGMFTDHVKASAVEQTPEEIEFNEIIEIIKTKIDGRKKDVSPTA